MTSTPRPGRPQAPAQGGQSLRRPRPAGTELGVRVLLDAAQYTMFKAALTALIDPEADSLRFYRLGNQYKTKVEHVGRAPQWAQDDILLV